MNERINLDPYDVIDLEPGETKRVDHTDCPAGVDTRQRLYITRKSSDADIVAYCHNCGNSGYKHESGWQPFREAKHKGPSNPAWSKRFDEITEPKHLVKNPTLWSGHANSWRLQNKLDIEECKNWNIAEDPSSSRIFLPQYDHMTEDDEGELIGYQLRRLIGRGPKYTTVRSKDNPGYMPIIMNGGSKLTVIVEDYISAIHLCKPFNEIKVLVNYGTRINTEMLYKEVKDKNVLVWLDNDSDYIIKQGRDIARTAKLFGAKDSRYIHDRSDPKHYSKEEILETLDGYY